MNDYEEKKQARIDRYKSRAEKAEISAQQSNRGRAMKDNEDRLYITGIEVQNFKRIDLVRMVPHAKGVTIIGGENAQGKSSFLDATMAALAGAKVLPDRPLRGGTEEGHAIVDLNNGLVVERTFNKTKKGGDLIVKTKDGHTINGAQTALDDPFGGIGFDPVRFIDVKNPKEEREQMQQLQDALGLDFTGLDCRKDNAFSERKSINSDIKKLDGTLATSESYPDAPDNEISLVDLTQEYKDASLNNSRINFLQEQITTSHKRAEEIEGEIDRLRQELLASRDDMDDYNEELHGVREIDTAAIESKMSTIEEDNRRARANHDRALIETDLKQKKKASEALTEELKKIDTEKRKMVEEADIPIEGLDFGEEGLIYKGISLKDASDSEKITVAIALADILSPKSRVVLIRRGSDLDPKTLRHVAELANKRGLQVLMERVSTGDEVDYIIEDGKVQGAEKPAEKETRKSRGHRNNS